MCAAPESVLQAFSQVCEAQSITTSRFDVGQNYLSEAVIENSADPDNNYRNPVGRSFVEPQQ